MNHTRLAAIVFCLVLLTVFFNYIYVGSVRSEMLPRIDDLRSMEPSHPDTLEQTWKSRKRLLALCVPLTALNQIDMQFSEIHACVQADDRSAYLRACYRLHDLVSNLGR